MNEFTLCFSTSDSTGKCIWYDRCGLDPTYSRPNSKHYLMCSYEDKAKPATLEMLELIQELCPHLVVPGNTHVCCSINQLKDMKKNFELPASLIAQTCPTCYYNFKRNFCDLTCHPEQSKFLRVDSKVDGIGDGEYTGNERLLLPMYRRIIYYIPLYIFKQMFFFDGYCSLIGLIFP